MTAGAWSFLLDVEARRNVTRLAGQTALITGGGTGMGRAIAWAFSGEGAGVAVAGRRIDKLKEVVGQIEKQGGQALAVACDVTQSKDTVRAVGETVARFGRLDVLVNNAGALHVSTVQSIPQEDWDLLNLVNVTHPFLPPPD